MLKSTTSLSGELWSTTVVLTLLPTPYLWLLAIAIAALSAVLAAGSVLLPRRFPV